MKKFFAIIAIVAISLGANAQAKLFSYGVEGGLNFNKLSFSIDDLSTNKTGFFIGPKVKMNLPLLGFGLDAAALYSMNRASVVAADLSGQIATFNKNLSYIQIPLNLRYDFNLSILGLYIATGPQYNVCLSSDNSMNVVGLNRTSTWSWNFGAGIELFTHIQLGLTYSMPISDGGFWPTQIGDVTTKNKTINLRLGYYF